MGPRAHARVGTRRKPGDPARNGKLVASARFTPSEWELYNLKEDRTETNNLVDKKPEKARTLDRDWNHWAERVGVVLPEEKKGK